MKYLVFGFFILASCTHSPSSTPATTTTAVIPAAPIPSTSATPAAPTSALPTTDVGTPSNANACGLPADWTHMNHDFTMPIDELVVLDWKQRADSRPLVVDDAFVWARGHEGARAYWFLATLYRHPKDENKWRLAVVYDAPIVPEKMFEHAPTTADADTFLKNTTWADRDDSFKQTGGRRCNAAWSRLVDAPL